MRVLGSAVLGTGVLALFLWLCSYSWILGVTPPTPWIDPEVSPWLAAEIGAVVAGGLSLSAGLLLRLVAGARSSRASLYGAAVGGLVMVATLASLLAPA